MSGSGFDVVEEDEAKGQDAPASLSDAIARSPIVGMNALPPLPAIDQWNDPLPPEEDASRIPSALEAIPIRPRDRRMAEYVALGHPPAKIADAFGLTAVRVRQILADPRIKVEIQRISDRIHEETIGQGIKRLGQPALDHLAYVLTSRDGKVKVSEKNDIAKFIVEKLDGKAAQKHELGENSLSVLLDKLDAIKASGKTTLGQALNAIDVTPQTSTPIESADAESPPPSPEEIPKTEADQLADWVKDNPLG